MTLNLDGKRKELKKELDRLMSHFGVDKEYDMADFELADFIMAQLDTLGHAMLRRDTRREFWKNQVKKS